MITLYGIYENGKIIIDDKKNLPNIKAKVEIRILVEDINNKEIKEKKFNFHTTNGKLLIKSLCREDFYDDQF